MMKLKKKLNLFLLLFVLISLNLKSQVTGTALDLIDIPETDSISAVIVPLDVAQWMNFRVKTSYAQLELIQNQDSIINELKTQLILEQELSASYKVEADTLISITKALALTKLSHQKLDKEYIDLCNESKKYKKQRNRARWINAFVVLGEILRITLKK